MSLRGTGPMAGFMAGLLVACATATACTGIRTPLSESLPDQPPLEAGEPFILLLSDEGSLYRFDPATNVLYPRGRLACAGAQIRSMTVDGRSPLYVGDSAGRICRINPVSLSAEITAFDSGFLDGSNFGMAVLAGQDRSADALYLIPATGPYARALCKIDTATYEVTVVGPVKTKTQYVELTPSPGHALYGLVAGTYPWELLQIDPSNGATARLAEIPEDPARPIFALVYWDDGVLVFLGTNGAGESKVYRYSKANSQVTLVARLTRNIAGAGLAIAQ